MQIILLSNRFAQVRSLHLSPLHFWSLVGGGALLVLALAGGLAFMGLRLAVAWDIPLLRDAVAAVQREHNRQAEVSVKDHLKAMAEKVGELQARLLQMDAVSERVGALAGIKASDVPPPKAPGKGGPYSPDATYRPSAEDLGLEIDRLQQKLEFQNDYMTVLEVALHARRLEKNGILLSRPVEAAWNASSFGWRVDPFFGTQAMHEGIDFVAEPGTRISAAGPGVVSNVETHPQYGLMVEIDHGNDYVTRYAHTSKVFVEPGQWVRKGDLIAHVGSSGRSTGPHLHFEVRHQGQALNPARFIDSDLPPQARR